jgi:HflK protein
MTDENQENREDLTAEPGPEGGELDAAGKSLSEALRISFVVLKVIMIVLVVLFLASGFRTVESGERALVLRFGKIRGVGADRILGPGLKPLLPYPIHEVVRIPIEERVNLAVNSFWYYLTPGEQLGGEAQRATRIIDKLDPIKDGYCITRSEKQGQAAAGSDGSDYSIVHCKWQLTYQIDDPERFFRNVYVEDIAPGQDYFEVMTESITPLLKSMFEDAVVTVLVNYTIDDVLAEQVAQVTDDVKALLQEDLDTIESGIRVVSVQMDRSKWPRQVDDAFEDFVRAKQDKQADISKARTYAEETLRRADGLVSETIAQARAYRRQVVEAAKADAEYLEKLLPEYRKRPELVIQEIYLNTIEDIFANADEKFVVQRSAGSQGSEVRVLVNRDPTIKPKSQESGEDE